MSNELVQLCLAEGAIDGALLSRLISDHDLGFEPERLYCDAFAPGSGVAYGADALSRLARVGTPLDSAGVEGSAGGGFDLGPLDAAGAQLIWRPERGPLDRTLIEFVAALPGFCAGYLSDADDVFWQSTESVDAYERAGRRHDHLPKAEGVLPTQPEVVDVSANPGRQTPLAGIWLFAASEMWFGAGAFEFLDRERLLRLPVGDVSERADGTIHVRLFPFDWYAGNLDEVRARQRQFREWMGLDDLEARADEIEDGRLDPTLEIETGVFPHGGVRLLTEWLDSRGAAAAPRSRAQVRRVVELSERGDVVWREDAPVNSG